MEKVRQKLEYDLEHTHAADHKKAVVIADLTRQLEVLRSDSGKVGAADNCRCIDGPSIKYVTLNLGIFDTPLMSRPIQEVAIVPPYSRKCHSVSMTAMVLCSATMIVLTVQI